MKRLERAFLTGAAIGVAYYVGKIVAYKEAIDAELERFLARASSGRW